MSLDVGVAIPAFDVGGCLAETIDGVLAQTVPPRQVHVFVDSASRDDTLAVARRYEPDVTVVAHEPMTSMSARDRAALSTSTPLVAPCDGDDVWLPTKLERQVAALDTDHDLDGVFCAVSEFADPGRPEATMRRSHERIDGRVASALLIRRTSLERVGGFAGGDHLAHWIEWLSIVTTGGLRLAVVDEILVRRRLRADGYTSRNRFQTSAMLTTMRGHLSRVRETGGRETEGRETGGR